MDIPTEIYQEIASYLPKADIDNLRLTCMTAAPIYLTDMWLVYTPTKTQTVDLTVGYYRCISSYICDGLPPTASKVIKSLHIRGRIRKVVRMSYIDKFGHLEYLRISCPIHNDLPDKVVKWPTLKQFVYDVEGYNSISGAIIYENAPALTHLYLLGIYLGHCMYYYNPTTDTCFNPMLRVLHTHGPISPSCLPRSLRVLSVTGNSSPFSSYGKMPPHVTTFIGTCDSPTGILTFIPTVTEIIVPMGIMITPFPPDHGVIRLVVNGVAGNITEAILADVDVTVTNGGSIEDYASIDAILKR